MLAHEGAKAYTDAFDLIRRREADRPNAQMPFEHQNAPNPGNLSLEGLSPELMEKVSEAFAYPRRQ